MLFVVPAQLLLANFDSEALAVSESHEQALATMTTGQYLRSRFGDDPDVA